MPGSRGGDPRDPRVADFLTHRVKAGKRTRRDPRGADFLTHRVKAGRTDAARSTDLVIYGRESALLTRLAIK